MQIVNEVSDEEEFDEDVNLVNTVFTVDVLLGYIQQLPDRYRLIFNLYVLDGYSHKEIAKMLEISEGTSKSNLSRARKILKEKLDNHQKNEQKK